VARKAAWAWGAKLAGEEVPLLAEERASRSEMTLG
jgi:hypothetical protein